MINNCIILFFLIIISYIYIIHPFIYKKDGFSINNMKNSFKSVGSSLNNDLLILQNAKKINKHKIKGELIGDNQWREIDPIDQLYKTQKINDDHMEKVYKKLYTEDDITLCERNDTKGPHRYLFVPKGTCPVNGGNCRSNDECKGEEKCKIKECNNFYNLEIANNDAGLYLDYSSSLCDISGITCSGVCTDENTECSSNSDCTNSDCSFNDVATQGGISICKPKDNKENNIGINWFFKDVMKKNLMDKCIQDCNDIINVPKGEDEILTDASKNYVCEKKVCENSLSFSRNPLNCFFFRKVIQLHKVKYSNQ